VSCTFECVAIVEGSVPTVFIEKYLPGAATPTPPLITVTICSATKCNYCGVILYDEDILSGYSPQDSDLSTT